MEAGEQAERQRREVVGDLLLRDLIRAQPDDREDAEQAHPQPDADLDRSQRRGDRDDPDVEGNIGQQQIPAAVTAEVQDIGEYDDGDQIGAHSDGEWH